jgi:hypothetical protein
MRVISANNKNFMGIFAIFPILKASSEREVHFSDVLTTRRLYRK